MYRLLIPMIAIALLIGGCPGSGGDDSAKRTNGASSVATGNGEANSPIKTTPAVVSPIARGEEIYFGTDYSNTSLTCAHCHSADPADDAGRTFIAHSGHGAYKRGAWKITSEAMLDAGAGHAADLLAACNACVSAPYMDHGDQLIDGDDGESLLAYLESIATDDEAFIIAKTTDMPVSGLTPDKAHGQEIYQQSCAHCHGTAEGVEELEGASEWLNPLQVMAKVRKIGEWYNDWDEMEYAVSHVNYLAILGVGVAHAGPEHDHSGDENPCGENPCGESHGDHDHDDDHGMFGEGAMPFYGTDILSDQDVVDVSFYVAEDL